MKNAPALFSDVQLDRITVPPHRLRELRPEVVNGLAESIENRAFSSPFASG
jgi:hypothetical protein